MGTPHHALAVSRNNLRLAVEDEAKRATDGNECERLERCIQRETAHPLDPRVRRRRGSVVALAIIESVTISVSRGKRGA